MPIIRTTIKALGLLFLFVSSFIYASDSITPGNGFVSGMDGSGNTYAAWVAQSNQGSTIQTAMLPAGSTTWTNLQTISAADASAPQIAVHSSGAVNVIWQRKLYSHVQIIETAFKAFNTPLFSIAVMISSAESYSSFPQIVVDGSNNVLAAWIHLEVSDSLNKIQVASNTGNLGWSEPENISINIMKASNLELAMNISGEAVLAWMQASESAANIIVKAATRSEFNWSAVVTLSSSSTGQNATSPQVLVDASGNRFVAWLQSNGPYTDVQATTSNHSNGWLLPASLLSSVNGIASSLQLGFNQNNAVQATWLEASFPNTISIQSSIWSQDSGWSLQNELLANRKLDLTEPLDLPQACVPGSVYNVYSIPYAPFPYVGTNAGSFIDDTWSGVIPLPFPFQFFGINYTAFIIGTNGEISFDLSNANQFNTFFINAMPSPTPPDLLNTIMAPWHDIDPRFGGTLSFEVFGTAPNRVFVVSWANVPMFDCHNDIATQQIVLHEGSNIIDINIENKPLCLIGNPNTVDYNVRYAVEGIQNATGTIGFTVPGRNFPSLWSVQNDSYRFDPTCPNPPIPPTFNFQGCQRKIKFLFQKEFFNVLTWNQLSGDPVTAYFLYRNGVLIATLPPGTTSYEDHNRKDAGDTYTLVAESNGTFSNPVTITVGSSCSESSSGSGSESSS